MIFVSAIVVAFGAGWFVRAGWEAWQEAGFTARRMEWEAQQRREMEKLHPEGRS